MCSGEVRVLAGHIAHDEVYELYAALLKRCEAAEEVALESTTYTFASKEAIADWRTAKDAHERAERGEGR